MGRIRRRFRASNGAGKVTGQAKIDSGADRSVLPFSQARRLGLLTSGRLPTEVAETAGGSARLYGFSIPVTIEVRRDGGGGILRATLQRPGVFVPTHEAVPGHEDETPPPLRPLAKEPEALLGHDFLQGAKAKLRYSTRRGRLDGLSMTWAFRKLTPSERRALRAHPRSCPVRRRKKRRASGG